MYMFVWKFELTLWIEHDGTSGVGFPLWVLIFLKNIIRPYVQYNEQYLRKVMYIFMYKFELTLSIEHAGVSTSGVRFPW